MSLVQDDDVVEKLAADGADHPLGERVLPGGAWCRKKLSDAHALHASPKLATVDAISIAEEIAWRRIVGKGFDNLLRRPSGSGRVRDVEVYDSSSMVQQDHEHVEDSECHSRHDEEVDGDKIGDVIFEEGPPGLRGRFRTARPTNRALRDVETELEELAMNARRTPEGIGEGHGADELGDLQIDGRTTCSAASRFPVPGHTEALPVPANHGLRLNDMERFAPPCAPPREPHPEDAVEETDPRSLGATAEQGELLSQRQVLKNEVGAGLQCSAQSAQQSEYEGHCYAGSLDRRPTSSVATDILANDKRATVRAREYCAVAGLRLPARARKHAALHGRAFLP